MDQEKEKTSSTSSKEEQKNDWSSEHDTSLQNIVTVYGTDDWEAVAGRFNAEYTQLHRTGVQCSARWQEILENESAKKSWTEQDELSMIVAHKRYKNKWADISEALKGRSNNTIKNKFYSVFRKIRGKILKGDCSYTSKLELLEIHYIISLIEQYLAHPILTPKPKGKRGKDFIYSLIHSLNEKMVEDYKIKIQELAKSEGSMEELFSKLSEQLRTSPDKNAVPAQPPPVKIYPQGTSMNVVTENEKDQGKNNIPHAIAAVPQTINVPSRCFCEPVKIEDERLLNGAPLQREVMDSSPLFGHVPVSPAFMFSPVALSAGPAAAAAGANRAACFGHMMMNDFSEFSNAMKTYKPNLDATHPHNPRPMQVYFAKPGPIPTVPRNTPFPVQMQHQPRLYFAPTQ